MPRISRSQCDRRDAGQGSACFTCSPRHIRRAATADWLGGGWKPNSARIHSVAFTGSALGAGAKRAIEAASRTGGTVYDLGVDRGSVIARAISLRDAAAAHDIIVLHIQPYDSLPIAALTDLRDRPPILLVNHADHVFWLGASIADVVVCLRESGARLAERRRATEPQRIAIVPVPIGRPDRIVDRAVARSRLGLRESDVLAISVGAPYKFRPVRGLDFVAACADLVRQISDLQIRAIGPQASGSWAAIEASTGGRVAALGHQHDLSAFHAAADLYFDPFPFSSLTAFLEAGSLDSGGVSSRPLSGCRGPIRGFSWFGACASSSRDRRGAGRNRRAAVH